MSNDPAEAVYDLVRSIPSGRVATYGQVAQMVEGVTVSPREVGGIMNVSPPDVPWQRVVGAGGTLPIGKRSPDLREKQVSLLEAEGVGFLPNGNIDMSRYHWSPEGETPPVGLFDE
jgi:methylated-DNA-protein-cysteine methyltransferase related protein